VAYDWIRGEPRGKIKKGADVQDQGDCIDCKLCVHACPTGIDIRHGTQLECVNCTACIDACDEVMTRVKRPKGLIRISSYNAIKDGAAKIFTPRVLGYTGVLTALLVLLTFFISTRSDIETTILKVPGQLYQKTEDGFITNLYNVQFVNKTFEPKSLELRISGSEKRNANLTMVGEEKIQVPASELYEGVFFIKIPEKDIEEARSSIKLELYEGDNLVETITTKFLGPVKMNR
jgi:cytochrome c oxidase accessory protein FixG